MSLRSTKKQLFRAVSQMDLQRVIRQQLAGARDWEELITILLQIPRMVLPVTKTDLIIYDPSRGEVDSTYEWILGGAISHSDSLPLASTSPVDKTWQDCPNHELAIFNAIASPSAQKTTPIYCLPLLQGERKLGTYHLQLAQENPIQPFQIKTLNEIAPDLALAVENFWLMRSMAGKLTQSGSERQRIARYLHDTLAHNLAYMRLKLDEISVETAPQEASVFRHEILGLLEIANQSYEQVRNSLLELREQDPPNLVTAIQELGANIHRRAHFDVQLVQQGDPIDLPSDVARQILYFLRETLRNVEKHAHAQKVIILLCWSSDQLSIVTADDGQGFDPRSVGELRDSYGLQILEECAAELNGAIKIVSEPSLGTKVSLSVPLNHV